MSHKKMMIFATIGLLITLFFGLSLKADQITHKFKVLALVESIQALIISQQKTKSSTARKL
jgi:hypothetical protein